MPQPSPDTSFETVNFQVSLYHYSDGRVARAMITVSSPFGSTFRFASERVADIHPMDSLHHLGLTQQGEKMVADVRKAPAGYKAPVELIRLGPHHATFGPYPMSEISENTATILIAIRNAYIPNGRIRLTFQPNWPESYLNATLARLKQADCEVFIAQVRVSHPKNLWPAV
jgi:hypothetical protein